MTAAAERLPARRRPERSRALEFVRRHLLTLYALLAFAYLLVPIAIVIMFSFNSPAGRFNYTWQGFTLDNWRNWDGVAGICGGARGCRSRSPRSPPSARRSWER